MDVSNVLAAVASIIAIIAGGGVGLQRSRVALLRGDLEDEKNRHAGTRLDVQDLKVRLADQAAEAATAKAEASSQIARLRASTDAKIAALESDLRHAEALALRETKWADLDVHLDEHHQESMRILREIRDGLRAEET
jgi:hypothetical protein